MKYFHDASTIRYEGKGSHNPLAYRYYNPDEVILGKPMREHLRFAVCYWHTLCNQGADPFGLPTMQRPWDEGHANNMTKAKQRVEVFFSLLEKLDIDYFTFHDRDIAPEAETLQKSNDMLDEIGSLIEQKMQQTGKKLLWGTANLFSHPRYVHGAATSPNPDVFAYAASQVKKALELTHRLGGQGYVFWGGREGYETLLNTDMKLELENLGYLLRLACEHADKIGFTGSFYIEPKPKEPSKHQYDFDAASVLNFLCAHGLEQRFKLNLETNHATLAGHSMQHELRFAADNGVFGSVDANQGDLLLGWDTDEFPYSPYEASLVMYEVLRAGGFSSGGLNFDAHVRRGSFSPEDLLHAHVLGVDSYAKGLRIAALLWEERALEKILEERYACYNSGLGLRIRQQNMSLEDFANYSLAHPEPHNISGGQERLLSIINRYIDRV